jgi:hypothetical protein
MKSVSRWLVAGLLAAAFGCASIQGPGTVTIEAVEPALPELGNARHLVLLEATGRRSAKQIVSQQIAHQARATGYFTVQDRTREGHTVKVVGHRADLDGGRRKMPPGQVGVRVAIRDWKSHREAQAVRRDAEDGSHYTDVVPFRHGTVVLEVSLFDETGRAHVAEAEFEGHASGEVSKLSRSIVLERAAREAVGKLLEAITPHWVTRSVPLDDEDPAQAAWLESARNGAVASAVGDATRYFQRNPGNASAAYNLAVLLDAMGDHAEALPMYDRAVAGAGSEKPFYREAREGCARRLAAERALESGPVPASLAPHSR